MKRAAHIALTQCLGVKKSDSVLIVTDKPKKKIAETFFYEAMMLAKHVLLVTIPVGKIHGEEPPKLIAEAMKKYPVCLLITTMSLSHTNARKAACKKGARMASMPGITADMMKRCIPIDYAELTKINKKILKKTKKLTKVRIATNTGTDISLIVKNINNDVVGDNGIYKKPGAFGNLPAGEVCWAPVEGKTNGVFVVDASMFDEKMKKPITIKVKNGYAYEIIGSAQAKKLLKMIKPLGKSAFNIAELGIGTNPKAKITGNVLEDEKVAGTCHIALGNNTGLGGKTYAKCHLDGVIKKPTIFFDDKCIMKKGKLLI
ncbi:aminopeptidase [Candidatus Woesearchaeota archaeon]|nr:aminopeptidase [Candidatus Woesearchaeota archaeon]MBW2994107.1 aminopeptidase [Candidatus Woesearchaeota archaeon]